MIYTVTLNPSLDYIVSVDNFRLGFTNRTDSELLLPGGKGINVSIVLKNLGFETTALALSAGFVGDAIEEKVKELGIRTEFIRAEEGNSRINLKLKNIDGTEINGRGPKVSDAQVQKLQCRLDGLGAGDALVLAGSIPDSLSDTIYSSILKRLLGQDVRVVVDATGKLLTNVLEYHPFLVKPNNHELGEIFDVTLETREQVVPYAKRLQEMGAENVLVSMAKEGAIFVGADGRVFLEPAPEGKLVNGVGAGDSMVAGFLAGYFTSHNLETAFRLGVAAGSATAFCEHLAGKEEVLNVYNRMKQTKK